MLFHHGELMCEQMFGISWYRASMVVLVMVAVMSAASCAEVEERQIVSSQRIDDNPSKPPGGTTGSSDKQTGNLFNGYYDQPKAGLHYLYSLNPIDGSVTVINADTTTMKVVETGPEPLFMALIPNTDNALVLNTGADDLTYVQVNAEGAITTQNIETVMGANRIRVAPDGKHALVYYDAEREGASTEFGDFQTVTVLDLTQTPLEAYSMTVGFKPWDVYFKSDNTIAYVVNDSGVSVLDFNDIASNGSDIADLVTFSTNNYYQETEAFSISPDGSYAVFKKWDTNVLQMVNLQTGEEEALELTGFFRTSGGEIDWNGTLTRPVVFSDIQFSSDVGTVTLVEMNSGSILQLPLPDGVRDPRLGTLIHIDAMVPEKALFVPESQKLLVYRTQPTSEEMVVVNMSEIPAGITLPGWASHSDTDSDADTGAADTADTDSASESLSDDTETSDTGVDTTLDAISDAIHYVPLRKGIGKLTVSGDGRTAVLTHSRVPINLPPEQLSTEEQIDASWGYSLVQLDTFDVKLQLTDSQVDDVVSIPERNMAFLLFTPDRKVHQANLDSFVIAPKIELESPPLSAGLVYEANKVFLNQQHTEGRVSFVDVNTGDISTVTGFVLNSSIKD